MSEMQHAIEAPEWQGRRDSWQRPIEYGRCEAEVNPGRLTWALCRAEATVEMIEEAGSRLERHCYCPKHAAAARRRSRYNRVVSERTL